MHHTRQAFLQICINGFFLSQNVLSFFIFVQKIMLCFTLSHFKIQSFTNLECSHWLKCFEFGLSGRIKLSSAKHFIMLFYLPTVEFLVEVGLLMMKLRLLISFLSVLLKYKELTQYIIR